MEEAVQENNDWDARGKSDAKMQVSLLDYSVIAKGRFGTSATSRLGQSTQGIDAFSCRDLHSG